MDKTKIEWTDATWNPIRGCSPVSEGCRNCYAARMAHRFSKPGEPYAGLTEMRGGRAVFNGEIAVVESAMNQPMRWRRPRRIFVNSMSDLFHDGVSYTVIDRVFDVMAMSPQHTFQVLTKRPARMLDYLRKAERAYAERYIQWPLPNVWLGVSVENQKAADERIPLLMMCPTVVWFISCEPLLGPVEFEWDYETPYGPLPLSWVIAGGESGPGARPMHPDWVRGLRDQCAGSGVPFLFKQWGEHDERGERVGKNAAGRILDGVTHDEFPNLFGRWSDRNAKHNRNEGWNNEHMVQS